jgi:hypothetical protein
MLVGGGIAYPKQGQEPVLQSSMMLPNPTNEYIVNWKLFWLEII